MAELSESRGAKMKNGATGAEHAITAASEAVAAPKKGTAAFRDELRESWGRFYSGKLHAAFTFTFGTLVLAWAISRIHHPTLLQLATVPLTFLYANVVEWRAHKGVMHHKTRGFSLVHRRHTLEHHRFFTLREMSLEGWRDIKIVLFPALLIFFFFGFFAAPIAWVLSRYASENVAALFLATAMGYFLSYELLHLSYHLPPESLLGRTRLVRVLRQHHALHHDPKRMTDGNFNITFPVCDRIFGTIIREE